MSTMTKTFLTREQEEVAQAEDFVANHFAECDGSATYSRPASGSVQELFVGENMNEPYLLWMNKNKEMEHLAQAKENQTKEGKNPKGEKSQGERERREKRHGSQKQQMRQHITLF